MYWRYSSINNFYYITFIYRTTVPHVDKTTVWSNTGKFVWNDSTGSHTYYSNNLLLTQNIYDVSVEIEQSKNKNTDYTKSKLYVNTGDIVNYKITITNNSSSSVSGLTVTDPIFNALNATGFEDKGGIYTSEDEEYGLITWGNINIDGNGSITLTYKITIPEIPEHRPPTYDNTVTVNFTGAPAGGVTSNTVSIEQGVPDLQIKLTQKTKDINSTTTKVNLSSEETITYTLTVTNEGTLDATNVFILGQTPPGFILLTEGTSPGYQEKYPIIRWNFSNLEAGSSIEVNYVLRAPKISTQSEINVQAAVYSSEIGNPIDSNLVKATLYQSALSLSLYQSVQNVSYTINEVSAKEGESISYNIEVYNHDSTNSFTNIKVTNEIPNGLTVTQNDIFEGGILEGNIITWTINSLEPQKSIELSFRGVIQSNETIGDKIENLAKVYNGSQYFDSNTVIANIVKEETVQDVIFEKTATLGTNTESSSFTTNTLNLSKDSRTITYKLTVNNPTTSDLLDVIVMDRIPVSSEHGYTISSSNVTNISNSGIIDNGTLIWTLGVVETGKTDLYYTVEIPETETKETWNNQATVTFFSNEYQLRNTNPVTAIYTPESTSTPSEPEPEPEPEPSPSPVSVIVNKTQSVNGTTPTTKTIEVSSGDKITYNIQVSNTGSGNLTNLVLTDSVPEGGEPLILDESSITPNGSVNKKTIVWTISSLKSNESINLTFTTVVPVLTSYTSWKNFATLTGFSNNQTITSNTVTANFIPQAELTIELSQALKGNSPQIEDLIVNSGDIVEYTIEISNPSKVNATNIFINDNVPEGLSIIDNSVSNDGVISNNTITWKFNELRAGKTQTITFEVEIPEKNELVKTQENSWTNYVELFYNNQATGIKSNNVTCELIGLNIEKLQAVNSGKNTIEPVIAHTGDTLTYTLEISNSMSFGLENITVIDILPDGVSLINNKKTGESSSQTWNIDKLDSGQSITLTIKTEVTASKPNTIIENTASAEIKDLNNKVSSNSVIAEVQEEDSGVFLLKEQSSNDHETTSNPITIDGKEPISYHLTVINNTEDPIYEVEVNDSAPEGCIVEAQSITGGGNLEGNNITWTVDYLEPQDSITFDFSCLIDKSDSSPIINTANLNYLGDQETVIQSNEVTANILGEISVIKKQGLTEENLSTDLLKIKNNSIVYYEITVTNNTNNTLTNIVLSDPISEGLNVNPNSISEDGTINDNFISWNQITIEPQETVSFNFNANANFINQNEIINTANLTGNNIDNQNSNSVILQKIEDQEQNNSGNQIPQKPGSGTNFGMSDNNLSSNNNLSPGSSFNPVNQQVSSDISTNNQINNKNITKSSSNPKTGINEINIKFILILTLILVLDGFLIIKQAISKRL